MKKFEILWISFIFVVSAVLGIVYSIYNADPHHWGFIVGTAMDYIQGKHLFTEVYVQYGVGQILLFGLLNHFFAINYTSVGIVTSLVYATNLLVIYFGLKRMWNMAYAMVITTAAFVLHTYAIYPWPDYCAGLCLSLACYFLIVENDDDKKHGMGRAAIVGLFLFLATIFRNTYLVNVGVAGVFYLVVALLVKRARSRTVCGALSLFFGLTFSYLIFLYLQGNLALWYGQGIGAGTGEYGINMNSVLWLLYQVFLPAKPWIPNNLITTSFSFMYYSAIFIFFVYTLKKNSENERGKPNNGVPVFLAVLGLAGVVQAMNWYQVFRIQNSCAPLYFVAAYFAQYCAMKLSHKARAQRVPVAIAIYLVLLFIKFPNATAIYPLHSNKLDSYGSVEIPIFKGHKFNDGAVKYYEEISKIICKDHQVILNLTMDSTLPHLCLGQESALPLSFYFKPLVAKFYPLQFEAYEKGEFSENMVIVSDQPIALSPKVKLTKIAELAVPTLVMFGYRGPVDVYSVEKNGM